MSRTKKRKVRVVLSRRVARDPGALFDKIEAAFRPGDLEIEVKDTPKQLEPHEPEHAGEGWKPDEIAETEMKKAASDHLDAKQQRIDEKERSGEPEQEDVIPKKTALQRARDFLVRIDAIGWILAVKKVVRMML